MTVRHLRSAPPVDLSMVAVMAVLALAFVVITFAYSI